MPSSSPSAVSDAQILKLFYKSANGDQWKTKWDFDRGDYCVFDGVTCNSGEVTKISLRNNNLSGSISTQIGQLNNLEFIRLDGNSISGTIPTQIGQLIKLTKLRMEDNALTGTIPSEIGNLIEMTSLRLDKNELSGFLPTQISRLTKLTFLNLGNNVDLSGCIRFSFNPNPKLTVKIDDTKIKENCP